MGRRRWRGVNDGGGLFLRFPAVFGSIAFALNGHGLGVVEEPVEDDFAALWHHSRGPAAAARLDLLDRVRLHKSRFFASGWSHFETARPGSLRLLPPDSRIPELRKDYAAMKPMFLVSPPSFEDVLATLRQAEESLNRT